MTPAASSLQGRARAALAARLREQLGAPTALHADGEHTRRFADALVPGLATADIDWAHGHLVRGAPGEVRPTRAGAVPVHAAWSSTALVCSTFAPWHAEPGALRVAGLGGFAQVRLEERLLIPHGGGSPNLDVALEAPGLLVGVESKLTEHLASRRPRAWASAYRRPSMLGELHGGWAALFTALLDGTWAPRHLDAAQLVRHALSLVAPAREAETHLVLLFWEPADGDAHPEVLAHRAEVAELLERVGDQATPRLHAISLDALLTAWTPERPAHVAALRDRYDVSVGP